MGTSLRNGALTCFFLGIFISGANGQAPAVSCPRDTVPYRELSKVKTCDPKNDTCPQGFFCNYDGLDDRYICCGKAPGYCDAGRVQTDPTTGDPKECSTEIETDCEGQYYCRSRNSGSKKGYCCLMVDEQEPPPVGCPWGTRPLMNANNQALTCTPGKPGACPGTSICYFDSVEKSNKCCGRDPGEGCPRGNKAVKNGNNVIPCTPGNPSSKCPNTAICQWSYLIDRYQCCESDNGCPSAKQPLLDTAGQSRTCQKGSTNTCGIGNSCDFNFWIAAYQCCGSLTSTSSAGVCPVNQVAYIDLNTGVPRTCSSAAIVGSCPAGYFCQISAVNQPVCCGPVGQCPAGQQVIRDAQNRAQSCSPVVPNSCSAPATCQVATGGVAGQYLCCGLPTINQCPNGRTPYPTVTNPSQCTIGLPNSCPFPSTCERTALSGLSICCSGSATTGSCPSGWSLQNNVATFCVPTNPTCLSGSSCLQSNVQFGQYLCCVLSTSRGLYTCPTGTPYQLGGSYRFCNQFTPNCPVSTTCQQAANQAGTFLCCSTGVNTYTCSVGTPVLSNGAITFCSVVGDTVCPRLGAACRPTNQVPSTNICCSNGAASFTCPVGTPVVTPGTSAPTYCNTAAPNCPSGASCLISPSATNTAICCQTSGTAQYSCPNNMTPQRVGTSYQFCSTTPPTNCGAGSSCQAALNVVGIYICCIGSGTAGRQYFCPLNATPYRVGLQYSFCSTAAPACLPGYQCLPSTNVPTISICCSSTVTSTYTCPNNAIPYRIGTTTPTCIINAPNCPASYTCQRATNVVSIYICCPAATATAPICPNNAQPQRLGTTYQYCSSAQPCQFPYTCQASTNIANTFVCCTGGTSSTYTCPINYNPYLQNGQPIFCNSASPVNCPGGTQCLQSVSSPQYQICCQSVTQSNLCPNNQIALLVGTSPQVCTGPGQACPQAGYTCQVSPTLGQYICCGGVATTARCRSNQAMYQPNGQMVYCSPQNTAVCPANYGCQQSTVTGQYVCCLSGGTTGSTCISGRTPYQPAGVPISCTGQTGICPSGTICEQSNVASQLICCTVALSTALSCPSGWQAYLLSGNQPQACTSILDTSCPSGYSCTQSTSASSGRFLCCRYGIGTTLRCYDSRTNPYIVGSTNQPQYCNTGSPSCPSGYNCAASTIANTFICCSSTGVAVPIRCLDGTPPYALRGGTVQYCYAPGTSTGCPAGHTCQTSSQPTFSVCCNGVNNRGLCPGSTPLIGTDGQATVCSPATQNCPNGYTCRQSTGSATWACCRSQVTGPRCIGRGTYLPAGSPINCNLPNTCTPGYECSAYTTTGQYICCNVARGAQAPRVCPGNAEPYKDPDTKEFHYCSNTRYACPSGYICKQRINTLQLSPQYICCSANGPMCQRGWLPLLDTQTRHPVYCSAFENNACKNPYRCQQSTVPSKSICCLESLISMENDRKVANETINKPVKQVYPFDDLPAESLLPAKTSSPESSTATAPADPVPEEEEFYVWGADSPSDNE